MITLLVVLLMLVSVGVGIARKPAALGFAMAAAIVALTAGSGVFNQTIDEWSTPGEVSAESDISSELIVILGVGVESTASGNTPAYFALSRILAAQQAYQNCKTTAHSCHILISGGAQQGVTESEAAVYKRSLIQASGISESDISIEDKSQNTWENAKLSAAWIKQHQYTNVHLVTSLIHMQRSLAYFNYFDVLPTGEASEATVGKASGYPTAWNMMVADIFVHEQMGIARFHLYNLLGWNK